MQNPGEKTSKKHWKIAMLPRIQVDAIVAAFLLNYFGEEKFPGIKNAEYVFWVNIPTDRNIKQLEEEGYILLDMGKGIFDHHVMQEGSREKCMSQIVAEYLGVAKNPSVRKLLEYARRDDLEGRGTLSKDPIDRAFGLSGLINNLNRMLPDDQDSVIRTITPLLMAHYIEEKKRTEDFPAEYESKLQNGQLTIVLFPAKTGQVKIVTIETDEIGMAGYLRARTEISADIVVQKMSSGHVNIITQQKKMFDLSEIARLLRIYELKQKGNAITIAEDQLANVGRVDGVEEWYFDNRAKTIQNGGIRPQWTTPTRLSLDKITELIKEGAMIKL